MAARLLVLLGQAADRQISYVMYDLLPLVFLCVLTVFVNVLLWGAVACFFLKQKLGSTHASNRLRVLQQPTISKACSQAGFFWVYLRLQSVC